VGRRSLARRATLGALPNGAGARAWRWRAEHRGEATPSAQLEPLERGHAAAAEVIKTQHAEGRTAALSACVEIAKRERQQRVLGHRSPKREHHSERREPPARGVPLCLVIVDRRQQRSCPRVLRRSLDRRSDGTHPLVVRGPPAWRDGHHHRDKVHSRRVSEGGSDAELGEPRALFAGRARVTTT
jgi:hypothetical protein